MRLNQRENIILYLAIAAVLAAVVANLFVAPFASNVHSVNSQVKLSEMKLKEYIQLISQEKKLKSLADKMSFSYSVESSGKNGETGALKEMDRLSGLAKLKTIEIRPLESTPGELLIDLRQEGDINAILKFLYDLEFSDRRFKVKKLELIPAADGILRMRLLLACQM
jgi:hypothetical protein